VARRPPHRSGRAALPHPALTLGSDGTHQPRVAMADPWRGSPPHDEVPHPRPRDVSSLASPVQHSPPYETDPPSERASGATVHGHPVVAGVSHDDRPQVRSLLRDGKMHALLKPELHFPQLRLPPLSHRLPQDREAPLPSLRATVCEAQEVERLRLTQTAPTASLDRTVTELDHARLGGMQLACETREPPPQ